MGSESFRIVNWLEASNHSHIVDVWSSLEAFEVHLAQPHSVEFRFSVQNQPPGGLCCIGSPIDDRQYSLVKSFKRPWTSNSLPSTGALFVITYVDFLQEGDPDKGQDELVRYGAATSTANDQHLLNYRSCSSSSGPTASPPSRSGTLRQITPPGRIAQ